MKKPELSVFDRFLHFRAAKEFIRLLVLILLTFALHQFQSRTSPFVGSNVRLGHYFLEDRGSAPYLHKDSIALTGNDIDEV